MNVGVDIRCLMERQRTGVGEYAFGLLNAVFKVDRENQYWLFYNSYEDVLEVLPKWDYPNVHYVGLRWPNKILNLFLLLGLIKLDKMVSKKYKACLPVGKVESRKSDCLKIENLDAWFSPNLNFTSLTFKTKFILTIHDLSFEFLPECYTFKQRLWHKLLRPKKQCRRADVILTPSENTARDVALKYGIGKEKVMVCYPGVSRNMEHVTWNSELVRAKYDLPEGFVLFLGTIEPRKNVEAVIGAFARAYDRGLRTYGLVIAGAKGWKNENVMRAIENTPNVRYIDYVSEEDKPALYKLACLFVYPSLYEGFGLPVLEAMACGTPVITSHRASLPEVGGDAVYYVNPANVAELSGAMARVLRGDESCPPEADQPRAEIMNYELRMERAKELAKKFNWEKSAEEFLLMIHI